MTLEEVVKGYRAQYVIEHRIGRLKGNPCLCRRCYLSREERVVGLIPASDNRFESFDLDRISSQKKLQAEHTQLREIYAGNPKRAATDQQQK
ncbi:MAG: hypothetical protein WKF84_13690 [Pyrinomonadaceae bacterium]